MERSDLSIARRTALSKAEFHSTYLHPEFPVILTDQVTQWPAAKRWDPEELIERYGERPVDAFYHPEGLYTAWQRTRLRTTIGELLRCKDPHYLTVTSALPNCPYLIDDFSIPTVVEPEWVVEEATIWLQPGGCRTGLHWDSHNSMMGVVRGRKRVLLFSPDHVDRLYPCNVTGPKDFNQGSWSQVDIFSPDLERFPRVAAARYSEIIVNAGEMLLIPRHWWHAVENGGDITFGVSFFVQGQGKEQPLFYEDRSLIAGLSIRAGVREKVSLAPAVVPALEM